MHWINLWIAFVYWRIQHFYLPSSRELKRIESTTRSPIFAHFQETLGGISTVRAYKQQTRFLRESSSKLAVNLRAFYPAMSLNRWLAVRLEFIGTSIVFATAMLAVVYSVNGLTDTGFVGLSLTLALSVTQALNWCIRQYCEIETNIVSMERLDEYSTLPSEAPEYGRVLPRDWPQKGEIVFSDYSLQYRAGLEPALKAISFSIASHEKVGIVGRTGAGKSSLTLGLFRILEASGHGYIEIDGVRIDSVGLNDLRSRLTIIPQDPFIFSGTVRENIDPFAEFDDASIWDALRHAHLHDLVTNMEGQLEARVAQGGENFSVGQRQLICLARALLRRPHILVLDEATAAIDLETDRVIQQTIRDEFKHCTVLTIAHRIDTVMDYDKILVLDKGAVAEYDTPQHLLQNPQSLFHTLSKEAGLI
jgi:ABC-type multidrug transport system fused ATPase/permease subunit